MHKECLTTVAGWMRELPQGFTKAGAEPRKPSHFLPAFAKLSFTARTTWGSGWLVSNVAGTGLDAWLYVTCDGAFYLISHRTNQLASRNRVAANRAAELLFCGSSGLLTRSDDGTIYAPTYDRDSARTVYTRDVRRELVAIVRNS